MHIFFLSFLSFDCSERVYGSVSADVLYLYFRDKLDQMEQISAKSPTPKNVYNNNL